MALLTLRSIPFLFASLALLLAPAAAMAQAPQTVTTPNPFGATPVPPPTAAPAPAPARKPTAPKTGQFASEADANASCPGDTIVWVNLNSRIFHYAGSESYGTTKRGAYMCEKDTAAAGYRAAKNEKRK